MDNIEQIIIAHLCNDEEYIRKVIPFMKEEYFGEPATRQVFNAVNNFVDKYNSVPSKSALLIALQENRQVTEELYGTCETLINAMQPDVGVEQAWLLDETEKFCKDKALYNAIMQSIQIIDGGDKSMDKGALPSILSEALGVGFDNNVGHDYLENADARYEFYHRVEEMIPFDLDYFNRITDGGLRNKTLNVALAGTGVGKSLFMCHMAASCIAQGKNVLYITCEMAEERIAERIDANMMNVAIGDLKSLSKKMFDDRVKKIQDKVDGRLIIKEYPTASAHAGHFKALLDELRLKRTFAPDIIFIDYLNICLSSRFGGSSNANSYTIIKSIAEELRGLAVEMNVPIVTATQTTRGGYNNSDVELTDTSECIFVDEKVTMRNGETKRMGDVVFGDQIKTNDDYKTVMKVHHPKTKDCVKILLKSGKTIIVSKDHVFPTSSGRKSVNTGLQIGSKMNTSHD